MCKRLIINAGIKFVVVRIDKTKFGIIDVNNWVEEDESLVGKKGY